MYVVQGTNFKELHVRLYSYDPLTHYSHHNLVWDSNSNVGSVNMYFNFCHGPYGLFYVDTVFQLNHPDFPNDFDIELRLLQNSNPQGTFPCNSQGGGPSPTSDADTLTIEEQYASINELVKGQLKIYPNPAISFINITCGEYWISRLVLYNDLGEKVATVENTTTLQLNSLDSGFYFLKIYIGDFILTEKIVLS